MGTETRKHTFQPPVGLSHLLLLTAIGGLGLGLGFLLHSWSSILFFVAVWLVPLAILAAWRRSFAREVSINPDQSLDVLLYSGRTRRLVQAEGVTPELKHMGRMQYLVMRTSPGATLRVAIVERGEIDVAHSLFLGSSKMQFLGTALQRPE